MTTDATAKYDPESSEGWNFHHPSAGTWHVHVTHDRFLRLDAPRRRVDLWEVNHLTEVSRHLAQMLVLPDPNSGPNTLAATRDFLIAHLPALVSAAPQL